ncbi:MAG: hypothetical protein ACREPX_00335, partial [Rhodanobacteraceae bacterium]
ERELEKDPGRQFIGTMSPPLFLLLSIFIAHGIELLTPDAATHFESKLAGVVMGSDINLLIFRAVTFSLFPLVMSVGCLNRLHSHPDRETLRPPFFTQCFYVAPFALLESLAMSLGRMGVPSLAWAPLLIGVFALVWYIAVQTHWIGEKLAVGVGRAFVIAVRLFVTALVLMLLCVLALVIPDVMDALHS